MITVREAAEKILIIQGGGDVDEVEQQIQHQINKWASDIKIIIAAWQGIIRYSQGKARRRRHIVNALNRVKERSS